MNRPDYNASARAARELFERASHGVDPATSNRLRQMRRNALAPPVGRRTWLPTTAALAGVSLLAVLWWHGPGVLSPIPERRAQPTAAAAPAVDAAGDEDTELYVWLGDAPVAPVEPSSAP